MNMEIRVRIGFLYLLNQNIQFDSFGVEHIPKEINKFTNNDIKSSIFRIQAYTIQLCADIFVSNLLIICLKVRHY